MIAYGFLGATFLAAGLLATSVLLSSAAQAGRCGMINVGTPDKPKIIADPSGCSSSR